VFQTIQFVNEATLACNI